MEESVEARPIVARKRPRATAFHGQVARDKPARAGQATRNGTLPGSRSQPGGQRGRNGSGLSGNRVPAGNRVPVGQKKQNVGQEKQVFRWSGPGQPFLEPSKTRGMRKQSNRQVFKPPTAKRRPPIPDRLSAAESSEETSRQEQAEIARQVIQDLAGEGNDGLARHDPVNGVFPGFGNLGNLPTSRGEDVGGQDHDLEDPRVYDDLQGHDLEEEVRLDNGDGAGLENRGLPSQVSYGHGSQQDDELESQENEVLDRQGPRMEAANLDVTPVPIGEHDDFYAAEIAQSRRRQHGPVANKTKLRKVSAVFQYRKEKPHRTNAVYEIVNNVYRKCCQDQGCGQLRELNLPGRGREALKKPESRQLANVLMATVQEEMSKAGFRCLDIPLVQIELEHLRTLIAGEDWCPGNKAAGRRDIVDPEKDALFYFLYRRNWKRAAAEARLVVYEYAASYGLQDIRMREPTTEFLEKCMELKMRTQNGVLKLTQEEVEDLCNDQELQEMILSKIITDDLSNLTGTNSVPWLSSYTAIELLSAKVMGVERWDKLIEGMRIALGKYGKTARSHLCDPAVKKYIDVISEAEREHDSDVHVAIRLLSAVLGVNKAYLTIAKNRDEPAKELRKLANGTQFQSCIISSRRTGIEGCEYAFYVQGNVMAYSNSLTKIYSIFFLAQNLLYLDSQPGSKSLAPLVQAVNYLSWGLQYRRKPLGARFDRLTARLRRLAEEDRLRRQFGPAVVPTDLNRT